MRAARSAGKPKTPVLMAGKAMLRRPWRSAKAKQIILSLVAALPNGADRMDDVASGQAIASCQLGLAGRAAAEGATLLQQLRPRRPMNGPIYAAAAE
jgi:hypothetical protein